MIPPTVIDPKKYSDLKFQSLNAGLQTKNLQYLIYYEYKPVTSWG